MSTEQQENLEAALRRSPIPVGSSVSEQRRLLRAADALDRAGRFLTAHLERRNTCEQR